jgi:hypothetical protein
MALATVRLSASLPMWVAQCNRQGCRWYRRDARNLQPDVKTQRFSHPYLHLHVVKPECRCKKCRNNKPTPEKARWARRFRTPTDHGGRLLYRNPEPGCPLATATGPPRYAGEEPAIGLGARARLRLVTGTARQTEARAMALATVRLSATRPMWVAQCNRQGCRWYRRYLPLTNMVCKRQVFKGGEKSLSEHLGFLPKRDHSSN